MTLASLVLLVLVAGLFAYDCFVHGKNARFLVIEAAVFGAGAVFIVAPGAATWLAQRVGIGRGVDFVLYPAVIWLVRETLATRRHRFEQEAQLTALAREMAIRSATCVSHPAMTHGDGQGSPSSASRTT